MHLEKVKIWGVVRDPVGVVAGAVIKEVLLAPEDFVFAQNVEKKYHMSKVINAQI